ncbi:hypothetical protein NS506_02235 [Nocardia seriolae]|uniref:Uncharacterized protein n=1 Tax=Nocardia seriolae TaxID=37332 RepID=A0ABC8AQ49_9NOCA|nr:hypothetical protein NS506_02235 [Nocardia seriolae]
MGNWDGLRFGSVSESTELGGIPVDRRAVVFAVRAAETSRAGRRRLLRSRRGRHPLGAGSGAGPEQRQRTDSHRRPHPRRDHDPPHHPLPRSSARRTARKSRTSMTPGGPSADRLSSTRPSTASMLTCPPDPEARQPLLPRGPRSLLRRLRPLPGRAADRLQAYSRPGVTLGDIPVHPHPALTHKGRNQPRRVPQRPMASHLERPCPACRFRFRGHHLLMFCPALQNGSGPCDAMRH